MSMIETEVERARQQAQPHVVTALGIAGCEYGLTFQAADKTVYGRAVLESCRDCHGKPQEATVDKDNLCALAVRSMVALRNIAEIAAIRSDEGRTSG